jgi:predicted permease
MTMSIESLWRDFVLAARRLRATPIFTIFAAASLALGVGATTAVYSAVYSLMWRPSGVQDADRVVLLAGVNPRGRQIWQGVAARHEVEHLRASDTGCDGIATSARLGVTLTDSALREAAHGEAVTGEYFQVLGIRAMVGRTIQPADDDPSRPSVAVVSHRFWRSRFASDPAVIGRVVRVNGRPVEIIGVAAEPFAGLGSALTASTDVWLPASSMPLERVASLTVLGRLRAGRQVGDAHSAFAAVGQRLDAMRPAGTTAQAAVPGRQWSAMPYSATMEQTTGSVPVGAIVMTLVGLVLGIACANLANLVLGRGMSRRHEVAVRRALGASRWRLVREQLAESVILASLGAVGAYIVVRALLVALAVELPVSRFQIVQLAPQLNLPTVTAAATALLAAIAIVGLFPAWQLTRRDIRPFMASDAGGVSQRGWGAQKRSITWQVAMSLGLLLIGVVCLRAVTGAARHDSGVDIDRIAVGYLSRPSDWTPERTVRAVDALVASVRQQTGVEDAAVSSGLPFGTLTPAVSVARPGEPFGSGDDYLVAATPGIFRAAGISIVRGRGFDLQDVYGAQSVAVLSEHSARRLFGTIDVVGREMRLRNWLARSGPGQEGRTAIVIGVARDTDTSRLFSRSHGGVYVPLAQLLHDPAFSFPLTVVARTPGDPATLMGPLRAAVQQADPDLAIGAGSGAGRLVLTPGYVNIGILARLLGSLGLLAVILSMAGLYGVLSHVTARRTREMGLRMALGAGRRDITRLVVGDGLRPVVEGLVIGLVIATGARVVLHYMSDGAVSPVGPVTSALASLPLILAALLACYLPARRAARIEPNVALREP